MTARVQTSDVSTNQNERIFISYSEEDRYEAQRLQEYLKGYKIDCFLAASSIQSGDAIKEVIIQKASACDLGILILSHSSSASLWVTFELGLLTAYGKPIKIIRKVERATAQLPLNKVLFEVNQDGDWSQNWESILDDIASRLGIPKIDWEVPSFGKDYRPPKKKWADNEDDFFKHLLKHSPLRHDHEVVQKFSMEEYFLARHFLNDVWRPYIVAIESAVSSRKEIPLRSEARKNVAVELVKRAEKQIDAISVLKEDLWFRRGRGSEYHLENLKAMSKDSPPVIRRIFVVDKKSDLKRSGELLGEQEAKGIHIRWITRKNMNALLSAWQVSASNVLICDGKFMSRSESEGHDGYITTDHVEIGNYVRRFNSLWEAHEMQRISKAI